MPRYVMEVHSTVRILDENGEKVETFCTDGQVAIATNSKGVADIVYSTIDDYGQAISEHAVKVLKNANSK